MCEQLKKWHKGDTVLSKVQPFFKTNFHKVEQQTEGRYLIHGTTNRKDNLFQTLEPPVEYPSWECKSDIKVSFLIFQYVLSCLDTK